MALSDDPDRRLLQRDKATGFAMLLAVFALVPSLVGVVTILVPGTQFEAREKPLYWLILGLPLPWV